MQPEVALAAGRDGAVLRLLVPGAGDPDAARQGVDAAVVEHRQVGVDVVHELLGRLALDPVDRGRLRCARRGQVGALFQRDRLEPDLRVRMRGGGGAVL